MVVINVKIVSMSKDAYYDSECGFVRCVDGVFTKVGNMCDYSPVHGEEVVDGKGLTLYPGFIDAHCHLGMWNDALCFEGEDGNEDTDPSTPHLRAIDSVNPMDRCFEDAVNAGVTSVCTGVGSANPIGGSFIIMKTWGSKRVDKLIVKSPAAIKFALGENPKNTYNDRDETPVTRMATAAIIREQLIKAKRYSEDIAEYERLKGTEDEISRPDFDIKCEALLPLFDKEHPLKAHFHCHRADDIFTAIRLAKEFGLDFVLVHCTEGHLIAEDLAEEGVCAITGPLMTTRSKPELANATDKNPGILSRHGVKTAICTDYNVMPIGMLPICAGMAVREGMDYQQALAAITIHPAQIVGIADRVGSLAAGKDADFSVFSQDPLTIAAKPEMVVINGKIVRG